MSRRATIAAFFAVQLLAIFSAAMWRFGGEEGEWLVVCGLSLGAAWIFCADLMGWTKGVRAQRDKDGQP